MSTNERARERARVAGQATYRHEVVDHWPACTACGTPIRRSVDTGRLGMWRACGCPDVAWSYLLAAGGWQRVDLARENPQVNDLTPPDPG